MVCRRSESESESWSGVSEIGIGIRKSEWRAGVYRKVEIWNEIKIQIFSNILWNLKFKIWPGIRTNTLEWPFRKKPDGPENESEFVSGTVHSEENNYFVKK